MHTPRHPTRSITIMASALLALVLLSFVLKPTASHWAVVKILLSAYFPLNRPGRTTWPSPCGMSVCPPYPAGLSGGLRPLRRRHRRQTVFQNPMAAPDILGASSGACFRCGAGDPDGPEHRDGHRFSPSWPACCPWPGLSGGIADPGAAVW